MGGAWGRNRCRSWSEYVGESTSNPSSLLLFGSERPQWSLDERGVICGFLVIGGAECIEEGEELRVVLGSDEAEGREGMVSGCKNVGDDPVERLVAAPVPFLRFD